MKWSGVGAAIGKSPWYCSPASSAGAPRHDCRPPVVEAPRPVEPGVGLAPVDATKVVHDVAAADDEHAALAKRCQPGAEVEVVVERLQRVDRELDDGDVAAGEGVDEDGPRPVIDPPAVGVEADPGRLNELDDLLGELRVAGSWVLNGEQLGLGSRRSRGLSSAAPSRSPPRRGCTSGPRRPGSPEGAASRHRRHATPRCSGCGRPRSSACRVRRTRPASRHSMPAPSGSSYVISQLRRWVSPETSLVRHRHVPDDRGDLPGVSLERLVRDRRRLAAGEDPVPASRGRR